MSKEIHSAADFEKEITNHKGYALVDFWATWCPPCRMMAPVLESAEQQLGDKINFVKIDVDEQQQLAAEFDIMSIPTLVVFKDGKPVKRMSGYRPLDAFVEELKSAVESEDGKTGIYKTASFIIQSKGSGFLCACPRVRL